MCLSCYYLGLMDAIYPICPDCLFIGEGTGATGLAANWGGSVTSRSICCYCYQENAQQAHASMALKVTAQTASHKADIQADDAPLARGMRCDHAKR